jgi:hypothetical protein
MSVIRCELYISKRFILSEAQCSVSFWNWKKCTSVKQNCNIVHETATFHNPHNLSYWESCITRQLGLQMHLLSKSCIHKNIASDIFHKNIIYLNVCLLRICQVFSVSCKIVSSWVTTDCCFMSDMIIEFVKYLCAYVFTYSVSYPIHVENGARYFVQFSRTWVQLLILFVLMRKGSV